MADDKKKTTTTDNVEVKSDRSVDPQLILRLGTKDGTPFNAIVEVDLTVRNVNDRRVFGHAKTMDYIREPEVTIPINFNDSLGEWIRACEIPGAQLGYGVAIHLLNDDGSENHTFITKYMTPTNDPPITVEGIWNQYENDKPQGDSGVGSTLTKGTRLSSGEKFYGPHGLFYISFQEDGNLVVKTIDHDRFHWGSYNHYDVPLGGSHAAMHTDGNLHVYDKNNELLWRTEIEGGAALSITREGKPVIMNEQEEIVWMG